MSHDRDPPSIDTLLKGSHWEERVARARVRREQVLAAKAAGFDADDAPTAPELETFVRRNPAPPSTPQARKRPVLAIAGGVAVGAVVIGLAAWTF